MICDLEQVRAEYRESVVCPDTPDLLAHARLRVRSIIYYR